MNSSAPSRTPYQSPSTLHTHYTSGLGQMTQLKAIEAGVDIVDTDLSPLAFRTAHPATEPLVVALEGTPRDPGIDLNRLIQASDRLEQILQEKVHAPAGHKQVQHHRHQRSHAPGAGWHDIQISCPSSLRRTRSTACRKSWKSCRRPRKDLGYPPLVTPTSQIVGIQAVQNVLFGRYELVSQQVKDYAFGLYGQPPLPHGQERPENRPQGL